MANNQPIIGEVLKNRWTVIKLLGHGTFGMVWEVCDTKNPIMVYAMKTESIPSPKPNIKMELLVLRKVTAMPHFCTLIDCGREDGRFGFITMTLLGNNLQHLVGTRNGQQFGGGTIARLAIQSIEALETLHSLGFLHRDIIPENLVMGLPPTNHRQLFLVDFGLARISIHPGQPQQKKRKSVGLRGTIEYVSPVGHTNDDYSRCDDLWSLFYTLIKLRTGGLPWNGSMNNEQMAELKTTFNSNPLTMNIEAEFDEFRPEIFKLKFFDIPKYELYKNIFADMQRRCGYALDGQFEWE